MILHREKCAEFFVPHFIYQRELVRSNPIRSIISATGSQSALLTGKSSAPIGQSKRFHGSRRSTFPRHLVHVRRCLSGNCASQDFANFRRWTTTSGAVEIRKGHAQRTVGYVALLQFSQTRNACTATSVARSTAHAPAICVFN